MIETNLIPFTFAKDELELSLVVHTDKRPGKEHYKPLMKEKFPETLLKGNEKRLKKIERLYTNFGEPDKVDFKTTIKLSEQPMFSLHVPDPYYLDKKVKMVELFSYHKLGLTNKYTHMFGDS